MSTYSSGLTHACAGSCAPSSVIWPGFQYFSWNSRNITHANHVDRRYITNVIQIKTVAKIWFPEKKIVNIKLSTFFHFFEILFWWFFGKISFLAIFSQNFSFWWFFWRNFVFGDFGEISFLVIFLAKFRFWWFWRNFIFGEISVFGDFFDKSSFLVFLAKFHFWWFFGKISVFGDFFVDLPKYVLYPASMDM